MKKWLSLLLCMLLLCGCAPITGQAAQETQQEMQLFAINVGKADCLLLEYGGSVYMVDTGTAKSWGAVSAALKQLHVDRLDGVIVTHTDNDHAGGCLALASSPIEIGAWYTSAYFSECKPEKHPVVKAAAMRGEKVVWLKSGDTLPFADGRLTVLGPLSYNEKENCNSVVLLAEGAGGSMLLAGDMEFPEEDELMKAGLIPKCTVLKVGNHAESDATSQAFVQAVWPAVAVISTNSVEEPDTPSSRVLKALRSVGAQIALTQTSSVGVLTTIRNGVAQATLAGNAECPQLETAVQLTRKESKTCTTEVTNRGDHAVDVSGWFIQSERGNEIFVFPADSVLQPGQTVTITCLSTGWAGDYVWHDEKVWHKSKSDAGSLYDVYGRLINRLE